MVNNSFLLYPNKSSLAKKRSRMLNGGTTEVKGNKLGWWERKALEKDPATDIVVTITPVLERRPHAIAYKFFGKSVLFWLVLQYNNIVDVEEELTLGTEIVLPSRNRALSLLSSESPKFENEGS